MNYIYCFTNLINGKKYIGSTTKKPNERYNQHLYNARHKDSEKYNYPLYSAIRKYGENNFRFEILRELDVDEIALRKIEQEFIILFDCLSPKGYNQTLDTNHPLSDPLTYAKISNTKREQAKRVAEIDEDNKIIQIWRSIADCSEETGLNDRKIASCCRGERLTTGSRRFLYIDENNNICFKEYKRDEYKGAEGTTQVQSSSKRVNKLDDNDIVLKTYETIALAARENKCDASGISKVCRGLRKKCGGFKWKYE